MIARCWCHFSRDGHEIQKGGVDDKRQPISEEADTMQGLFLPSELIFLPGAFAAAAPCEFGNVTASRQQLPP